VTDEVIVRELVGWGIDKSPYRPRLASISQAARRAAAIVGQRPNYTQSDPILRPQPIDAATASLEVIQRPDLHVEMLDLKWTIGIVDLRCLIAFQRRLIFDDIRPQPTIPLANDWPSLMALTFGPPVAPAYNVSLANKNRLIFSSSNPNLQIRFSASSAEPALQLHAGSPFLEVAEYQNRWFLRDGYHRAYNLLRSDVNHVPAVVIYASSLTELGPTHPWFFSNDVLFGPRPPRVTDFIEADLIVEYSRPRLYKTFQVTIDESFETIYPEGLTPREFQPKKKARSSPPRRPTSVPSSNK
jgi:hypothetical protein